MHGDTVVARVEKHTEKGLEGRLVKILERAHEQVVGRFEADASGLGYVVPFDWRLVTDIQIPTGQASSAEPGDMVVVSMTRWPSATRGPAGTVSDVLGRIDEPGRRHADHHPQARDPRRASAGGRRRSPGHRRRRPRTGHQGAHRLPRCDHGDHRRRARARLRRRHHARAPAERPLLARRAHRRRVALRAGGECARRGGVRARHVGLLHRARGAHVPARARDRALQSQPARRSAGAVVRDGGGPARPGRALRDARRRDQQRRADDLHRRQRHPHR